MPIKYKLYLVEENGQKFHEEFYTKKELEKYKIESDEFTDLFECAERMVYKFNTTLNDGEAKRYAYKLEKISVRVIGSESYYGLNISKSMCDAEFS